MYGCIFSVYIDKLVISRYDMTKIHKRKYSRLGCVECKRRKMKCDEGKPFCYNCTRLNKECLYPSKTGPQNSDSAHYFKNVELPIKRYLPNGGYLNNFSVVFDKDTVPQTTVANSSSNGRSFTNAISDILTPSDHIDNTDDFILNQVEILEVKSLFDEAALLVNDMNDLQSPGFMDFNDNIQNIPDLDDIYASRLLNDTVADMSGNTSATAKVGTLSDVIADNSETIQEFSKAFIKNENSRDYNLHYDLKFPQVIGNDVKDTNDYNSQLIEQLITHNNLTGPHASYLRWLNKEPASFAFFPFASSIATNECVNLMLKYANNCPYLLSAILAMVATVKFNVTKNPIHETSAQKYFSVCLKTLSGAFTNDTTNEVNKVLNDIERLLLTVIILSSYFAAKSHKDNVVNSWKTHLRGAKDILINYSETTRNQTKLSISGGLALARTWFFAIEALATSTTQFGGTLTKMKLSNDDIDHRIYTDTGYFNREYNPAYHDALHKSGFLTVATPFTTEFNLFIGFTMNVVYLIQEYSKCLDSLRNKECQSLPSSRIMNLFSLVLKCRETSVMAPNYNRETFEIPEESPAHPNYTTVDPIKLELPKSAYGQFKTVDDKVLYYSWFDLSEQCHCDVIFLRVLLMPGFMNLPRNHPLVKETVEKLIGQLYFIRLKQEPEFELHKTKLVAETPHYYLSSDHFDWRAFMIQSSYRLCASLVEDENDFERLELFFKGLIKLGNGSAIGALDSMCKRREKIRNAKADGKTYDDNDDTAHTDIVPFA